MEQKLKNFARTIHPARLSSLALFLLKDEAISGKLIIAAVTLALIAANSPLASAYESFWTTKLNIGIGSWALSLDLRHWVSDALMAFFFLVVGLELSRELKSGELSNRRTALLPFAAGLGGMLVPAAIYLVLNARADSVNGWAIPTATDIALAIGILALLAKRIPPSIRIFLLTLAIVDDIAAVVVIALFYSGGIAAQMLLAAMALTGSMYILRNTRVMVMPVFIIAGLALWVLVQQSGVHPSITGAILGLLAPQILPNSKDVSVAERAERAIIPFSTLFVVPIFAFASTGIALNLDSFNHDAALQIAGGIIIGLVVGKVVGILGATWLMVRLGIAKLPAQSNWNHIIGAGMLAGIGFTVSIFVTELAFTNPQYVSIAKISIFAASAISAALGLFALRFLPSKSNN